MSVCDHTESCAYCKTKPKWIYRVGEQCICGACCAAQLAEARQENAKLRERVAELEAFIDSPEDVLTRKEGGGDER